MTQEQKPLQFVVTHPKDLSASGILNYICEANAEIRRLQQQLAAAPTWGEWQDATVKNLVAVSIGIYEFETNDGVTFLASKRHDNVSSSSWVLMDGQLRNACDFELNPRFRRLNYEPKPAREVEKTYCFFGDDEPVMDGEWTLSNIANDNREDGITELARDLLAAQARIRELEGK